MTTKSFELLGASPRLDFYQHFLLKATLSTPSHLLTPLFIIEVWKSGFDVLRSRSSVP